MLSAETTPVWLTRDRDGNVVEVPEPGKISRVNFRGLLEVFNGDMYTTKPIETNQSLLLQGAISFDSSISSGKFQDISYEILLDGKSYTWSYLQEGFTLNPNPIQSNLSGLIDAFKKQLAVVNYQSYFIAPNASRTATQSLKTFLYNTEGIHQTQLSSQAAKSNYAVLGCLALLSLFLIYGIYRIRRSCFREKK